MSETPDIPQTSETRRVLLQQLAHLGDEAAALERHVELIPAPVLEGRPLEGDPSFKEIYGLLAAADELVFEPAIEGLAKSESGRIDMPLQDDLLAASSWNAMDMRAIIKRVRAARLRLVDRMKELPLDGWSGELAWGDAMIDVFSLAYRIIQRDADLLRSAALRLHESHLTSREEDLPK